MDLKWSDTEELAIRLVEAHPDYRPPDHPFYGYACLDYRSSRI